MQRHAAKLLALPLLLVSTAALSRAADYSGPRPPKSDTLYLLHADTLVPTETGDAKEEGKNANTYVIAGASSSARTPLAEPIFIMQSEKITPDSLELYKLDVKGGRREVSMGGGRRNSKALHLAVTRLAQGLYRIEVDEELDNGEYVISPMGSSRVFCFAIY